MGITIENRLADGQAVEQALREALRGIRGDWRVHVQSEDLSQDYEVRVWHGADGPWSWTFSGPWEKDPGFIRKRLRACLERPIAPRERREEIVAIASGYGASNLRLFGSRARGESRPDSDLDVLVDLAPGRSLLDLVGLQQDLEELLGCKVDVVTERSLNRYIRDRVLAEATPL
jgi:predicted nucleotidyltransferase